MADKKISQLTAKAAGLAATDLIEISESDGSGGYVSKSVTGTNVLSSKQDTLVSGTNIKTVNSTTLLGAGDVVVQATLVSGTNIKTINSTTLLGAGDLPVQATLVSGTNIKTINSTSILGSGDLAVSTTPSGVAGAIQFSDGSAFSSDATNLSFDNTNDRLGVGQSTPTARVHIKGAGATNATTSLLVHNSSNVASLQCTDDLSVFSHGKGATATNTVFGKGAYQGTATGSQNTICGVEAGKVLAAGISNSLFGWQAGQALAGGGGNICIGTQVGFSLSSGNSNLFIGNSTGSSVTTGSNNICIGAGHIGTAAMTGTIMIGISDTATGSNQCRFGSAGTNAGAVTAEVVAQANTWTVFINGTTRKILLA